MGVARRQLGRRHGGRSMGRLGRRGPHTAVDRKHDCLRVLHHQDNDHTGRACAGRTAASSTSMRTSRNTVRSSLPGMSLVDPTIGVIPTSPSIRSWEWFVPASTVSWLAMPARATTPAVDPVCKMLSDRSAAQTPIRRRRLVQVGGGQIHLRARRHSANLHRFHRLPCLGPKRTSAYFFGGRSTFAQPGHTGGHR